MVDYIISYAKILVITMVWLRLPSSLLNSACYSSRYGYEVCYVINTILLVILSSMALVASR